MNRKLIIRVQGAILIIESAAMIPSLLVSLCFRDGDFPLLAICFLALLIPGLLLWFLIHSRPDTHLRLKEGFIVVALGWLVLSVGGALPFFFSGLYQGFDDAFFEAVSGFTTTGASIVRDLDHLAYADNMWRFMMHLMGGIGLVVCVAVASLASLVLNEKGKDLTGLTLKTLKKTT